jgi:hypothetical protein
MAKRRDRWLASRLSRFPAAAAFAMASSVIAGLAPIVPAPIQALSLDTGWGQAGFALTMVLFGIATVWLFAREKEKSDAEATSRHQELLAVIADLKRVETTSLLMEEHPELAPLWQHFLKVYLPQIAATSAGAAFRPVSAEATASASKSTWTILEPTVLQGTARATPARLLGAQLLTEIQENPPTTPEAVERVAEGLRKLCAQSRARGVQDQGRGRDPNSPR